MNAITDSAHPRSPGLGTALCLTSALCYAGANICLRQLAALRADPFLVICVKESVAVACVGPWLVWGYCRGRRFAFPLRALAVLVLTGLCVQLAGNVGVQWSFGVIGLAVSMPLIFGVMLAASAVIGLLAFGESLPARSVVAVALAIAAIVLLSVGSTGSAESGKLGWALPGTLAVGAGIAAACLGGAMFATLGAAIRYAAASRVPVAVTVFVVTGMGVASLGTLSLLRLGPEKMLATEPIAFGWMIASGAFNLIAFALITKGLELTTLVHANVLNASQVALGATAGILMFHEPCNAWLAGGVVLTVIGITLYAHPRRSVRGGSVPPRPLDAVLLLGPTGSGKTPLGQLLAARGLKGRRCVHFDFGQTLRETVQRNEPDGQISGADVAFLRRVLQTGALLEDRDFPIAQRLLRRSLDAQRADGQTLVVANGLPRHIGQAASVASTLHVRVVVWLECAPAVVMARLASNAGGDRAGRNDDDPDAVARKLAVFARRTEPLLDYYRNRGAGVVRLVVTEDMTPEQMWTELQRRLPDADFRCSNDTLA